uniref:Rubredoxin-like domain-containing protein n=1 Tax=Candidatus Caldatribacterium californiense TaxID=1454726 RepID=A0A7V3YHZ1_9BACT
MNLEALFSLNCGMYVVAARAGENLGGCIVNALVQVTAFPPQLVVSIHKDNATCELVERSGYFAVSVLDQDTPLQLIGLFGFRSSRETRKFDQVSHVFGKTGMPILSEHTVAYVEAKVVSRLDAGTHILFLGEVVEAEFVNSLAVPMTYAYYRDVKGGKVPRKAATYKEEKVEPGEVERYRCKVCGYIYDSRFGDPDSGIPAGTRFADLPETWVCPICGVGKDQFERV